MPDRFYQYRIRKTGNKCQTDLINTEFKELILFQTFNREHLARVTVTVTVTVRGGSGYAAKQIWLMAY